MAHNDRNQEGSQKEKITFEVTEEGNAIRKEDKQDPITVRPVMNPKKKRKKEWMMPVLLTIVTASVIGTVTGLFILNLFVGLDEDEVTLAEDEENVSAVTADPNKQAEVSAQEVDPLSSYVLQAGVFSERENAEEWLGLYDGLEEQSFIWERENQYYLFIGIYGTEDQARSRTEEYQANDIDVFMKEWQTIREASLDLSDEEMNWIHQFQETWEEALAAKDDELLAGLAEQAPPSSVLEGLVERLENPPPELDYFFLELMKSYESL